MRKLKDDGVARGGRDTATKAEELRLEPNSTELVSLHHTPRAEKGGEPSSRPLPPSSAPHPGESPFLGGAAQDGGRWIESAEGKQQVAPGLGLSPPGTV